MSVLLSAWNNSAPTRRIFMKFDIWVSFENLSRKIKVALYSDKNNGNLKWRTVFVLYHIRSIPLEWGMFQTNVVEQKMHILCSETFFSLRKSCRLWDNMENYRRAGRPHVTIWHMRIACWIPKATNTHSECVSLIAFRLQRTHLNVTL